MPTYDYRCNGCDHRFELFQSMKDSPSRKCPECGRNALEPPHRPGRRIIFKGAASRDWTTGPIRIARAPRRRSPRRRGARAVDRARAEEGRVRVRIVREAREVRVAKAAD